MDSQEIVSFQISIIGQDIEEVRSELDYLFDGFEYGRVEKNGEAISYTVNMPSVQADMLFYGGSGVELPEGWTVGYDAGFYRHDDGGRGGSRHEEAGDDAGAGAHLSDGDGSWIYHYSGYASDLRFVQCDRRFCLERG